MPSDNPMADSATNDNFIYFFANGQADGGSELKRVVGGKGASLADMTKAGFNVPPGFTISAECCQLYFQNKQQWPAGLEDQVRAGVARLEALSGRTFGREGDPLLVAVRSGAAESMPGSYGAERIHGGEERCDSSRLARS